MHWMSRDPAQRLYNYFKSTGYIDFDDIIKIVKATFSEKKIRKGVGFFDSDIVIWVAGFMGDNVVCLHAEKPRGNEQQPIKKFTITEAELERMIMPEGVVMYMLAYTTENVIDGFLTRCQ